jgi:uncharacterized protein YhaN
MSVVSACAFSFMSKYLHQSCGPKPMTRVDINDKNQSSNKRHILKLKGMLKEQEERNKTKMEEKEQDITRLKNKKQDMKVDDDISKSFETIIHLKTQIEEAKRVEEILKNQIDEKEESLLGYEKGINIFLFPQFMI